MSTIIQAHPSAQLFPMLGDEELQQLADDIKQNGLLEPILLYEGMILDGRNRFAACELAGIPAKFVSWDKNGASPTSYVLSKNLYRRNLNVSQRAAIAVESIALFKKEATARMLSGKKADPSITLQQGRVVDLAAACVGIGSATVHRASRVQQADPDEFLRLKRGEVQVNTAYEKLVKTKAISLQKKLPAKVREQQIRECALQGSRAAQIASRLGLHIETVRVIAQKANIDIPADGLRQGRNIDANRIINETVMGASALVAGLDLVDSRLHQIHASRVRDWVKSLSDSIEQLNRLLRQLKGIA